MLSFIYTPLSWFVAILEWALQFAGWEAFVTLKSETPALTDGQDYPRDFWSTGRTQSDASGNVEAWGMGLHAVLSPCERRRFWLSLRQSIVNVPGGILRAPVRLVGWGVDIERDAPGYGVFDTRFEGGRQSWEFWGFGLHVVAANDRALKHRWAEVRRQQYDA